jgi:hypothetical protein
MRCFGLAVGPLMFANPHPDGCIQTRQLLRFRLRLWHFLVVQFLFAALLFWRRQTPIPRTAAANEASMLALILVATIS